MPASTRPDSTAASTARTVGNGITFGATAAHTPSDSSHLRPYTPAGTAVGSPIATRRTVGPARSAKDIVLRVPPGTMMARLLVSRRVRVPGTTRPAFSTASIWMSSALRNSPTFAPSMICRASVFEPAGLSETVTPVAARYKPATSVSAS